LSVLGPAAAAAADSLGLGGFNLGALAGGLASGLRFPSPGATGGSDEGGSASSSVHGGALMQQQVQPAAAAGIGVTVYPATATPAGTAAPFLATATAAASAGGARGGASPQRYPQGPLAAAAAGNVPCSQQGPYGAQGAQQQQQQQEEQEVQAGLPPGPDHVWCGVTRTTLESLQPGGSADVALQVAVFRPGVYVIDDYAVDWAVAEGAAGARRRQGSKMGEPSVLRVDAV
jgi:hypothetical protein